MKGNEETTQFVVPTAPRSKNANPSPRASMAPRISMAPRVSMSPRVSVAPRASLPPQSVAQRLIAELKSDRAELPMLPAIAMEVWQMARDPEVDIDRLRITLEREPALAGRVLGIASSPVYAGKVPVATLRDGLMRLGQKTLSDVVFEVSATMEVFREPAYEQAMTVLQNHSLAVAYIARDLCQLTGQPPGLAFMAGLLHDVGAVALLRVLASSERRQRRPAPPLEQVQLALDQLHARTSGFLVRRWGLPEEVVNAVGAHESLLVNGEPCLLAATVCLADGLAMEVRLDGVDGHESQIEIARTALDLKPDVLPMLRPRAEEIARHLGARAAA